MIKDKDNLQNLLQEIDRYFDCLLTDEEENKLRKQLATTEFTHHCIDEAKALMGFRAPERVQKTEKKRIKKIFSYEKVRYGTIIAAVVTLVVSSVYVLQLKDNGFGSTNCLAFVNGKCIRDEDAVMEILFQNMSELDQATDEMKIDFLDELDDLASATEKYDSEFNLSDI